MKSNQPSYLSFVRKGIVTSLLGAALWIHTPSFAVNINAASFEVLQNVKGIGPTRAKAIIEERDKNGAFINSEDLSIRVRGIGDKTVEKMTQSGLTFDATEPLTRSRSAKIK